MKVQSPATPSYINVIISELFGANYVKDENLLFFAINQIHFPNNTRKLKKKSRLCVKSTLILARYGDTEKNENGKKKPC